MDYPTLDIIQDFSSQDFIKNKKFVINVSLKMEDVRVSL